MQRSAAVLVAGLRAALSQPPGWQHNRDPEDDDLFRTAPYVALDGNDAVHRFDFGVNDQREAGRLFVVAVTHTHAGSQGGPL